MNNTRSVSSLPLNPSIRSKLINAGYQTVKDLKETTPIELSRGDHKYQAYLRISYLRIDIIDEILYLKELELSTEEALDILQHCQKNHAIIRSVSASEALQRDLDRCPIFTSCEAIDKLFGGHGVPTGKITEFCGAPGIGKTQLGIQLSINVQIPKNLSGPGGEAIYIDTEGSFIAQRAQEIATATVQSLSEKSPNSTEPLIDVETILSRIHYFRIHDYIELLAVVKILDDYLKEHSNVKLVVIDSIAFHFRQNFSDMALRTRLLNGLAQDLTKLADSFDLAVVVILNQMTTKFGVNSGTILTDKPVLVPALGESWSHQCNNRVILYWRDDIRYAHLVKSSNLQEGTVPYKITSQGVRDVLEPEYVPYEEPHESINLKRTREQFQEEEQELSKRHLVQGLQKDLEKFEKEEDLSVGLQGQISASLTALKRTIDDYDGLAKRETIIVKQEKALTNVLKLRDDYSELKMRFDKLKQREQNRVAQNDRAELLGRRHNTTTPEYPFQHDLTREQHALREHGFLNETETKLDEFIAHGREVLNNIYDQNNTLKSAQRRILDAANTLGLSRNVIQYIERRSSQDTWIFIIGSIFTLFCMWAIVHYLT
ncbi:14302_t:CDS:10 [Ambispora leptoticha]|uniref:DNA repair protein RAD51 homolog 3 n=1 Tax=Ambispora leptoticha TaxID=144679 RepID=A0A9N9AMS1_9GLOM|nr:14302_t:CDS:10 [Ambispora leptoticha]